MRAHYGANGCHCHGAERSGRLKLETDVSAFPKLSTFGNVENTQLKCPSKVEVPNPISDMLRNSVVIHNQHFLLLILPHSYCIGQFLGGCGRFWVFMAIFRRFWPVLANFVRWGGGKFQSPLSKKNRGVVNSIPPAAPFSTEFGYLPAERLKWVVLLFGR